MNLHFLRDVAVALVADPTVPCSQTEIQEEAHGILFDVISMGWVYDFCARFNVKIRMRTGKSH